MGLYRRNDSKYWWMAFSVHGHKVNESSGTTNKKLAKRIYDKRLGEVVEERFELIQTHSSPSFKEVADELLGTITHPNTKRRYASSKANICKRGTTNLLTLKRV